MLATMSRVDDTVRPLRAYWGDTTADSRDQSYPSYPPPPYSTFSRDEQPLTRPSRHARTRSLTPEEIIVLTQRAVDTGLQETNRSLAGSEGVESVVRPKLTIDLGHSNIGSIPEAVVDIIKDEVARLSLSNNHIDRIPQRFSECTHLRYLNIRANNFAEFPKEVYNLSFLEILDLSRNKITKLPAEVRNLTSLRVLSVMQNLLEDLPDELSDMNKLQVLKVSGNALKYPLKGVLEMKEAEVSASELADNEKESVVTAELKRFLKSRQPPPLRDPDILTDSMEMSTDTPKPPKRGNRFPVIPRANGTDCAPGTRSPSLSRPPPIPTRSHHRMASGHGLQNGSMYSRPGIGFVNGNGNERNRSNSEGFIQASVASRSKRMGLVSRKNTDLGTLDEVRPYRNSHLRGLSHGSVLRSQSTTVSDNRGSRSPSSPGSPKERRRARDVLVPRLTSIPERRVRTDGRRHPVIEAAKGTLYSLFQVHSQISALIHVISTEDRRSTLEIVFYNAGVYLEHLNNILESANELASDDTGRLRKIVPAIKHECKACIISYAHVASQLRVHAGKAVSLADPKYIRSLMIAIYSSLVELRNAAGHIAVSGNRLQQSNSMAEAGKRAARAQIAEPAQTPTMERQPPQRRFRSETTIQHPPPHYTSSAPPPPPISTSHSTYAPTPTPAVPLNFGTRSRSSSRSNTAFNSSRSSSVANTPRSSESFPTITTATGISSRINPLTGLDELEEDRTFERIFLQLTAACRSALQALPIASRQFSHYLELAEEGRTHQTLRNLWIKLVHRSRICLERSEALHLRLSNMKVKEPGGGMRNQREFWLVSKAFISSFVDVITDMQELKHFRPLPSEIPMTLLPVQKATREASRLLDASPWSYMLQLTSSPGSTMTTPTSALPNGSSPQNVQIPVTPLGAALGHAAQATFPSTPASASSERFFAGDIFQRADSLLATSHAAPIFARR